MSDRGLPGTWRTRPPQVWVLVVMLLLGSLLVLPTLLRPSSSDVPIGLLATTGMVAPVMAALLWWPGDRWLTPRLHLAAATKLLMAFILVANASSGQGAMSAALVTIWIGLYTAAFHTRRAARAYLVGSSIALAVAMSANPALGRWTAHWLVVVISTVMASEVIGQTLHGTRELATTDHLTGLPNRLELYRRFEQEARDAARTGRSLALVVLDLDGFKLLNDRHGHLAGDRMLVDLTQELSQQIRGRDGLFRTGGDEFLLLLPETTQGGAEQLLGRLHTDSMGTWSYGISVVGRGEDLDAALARADRNMYSHKRDRRRAARDTNVPLPAPAPAA